MKITSKEILNLLAEKHSDDVFVPECKNGSTWFSKNLRKIDAWVMPRSWTKLKFIGYEIKVSRQDFVKDDKYQEYLKLCNEFYVVTSNGICTKDEVPEDAGLLELSKTGNRFFTKKKAPFRSIKFPEDLFIYLLMCRTEITRDQYAKENIDYWKNWLEDEEKNYRLGRAVSKKLQENYKKNVEEVKEENNRLKRKMESYDEFKNLLSEIGVMDKDSYYTIKEKIWDIKEELNLSSLKNQLDRTNLLIKNTIEEIEKYGE